MQQILEKKWLYNGTVHQLFIDFKKAYNSVRSEVLYSILVEFAVPRKLVGLIKCVKQNLQYNLYRQISVWQVSYSEFHETWRCFITIPFQFALEYAIRRVQEN
jgi:hypothetical protein